MINKTIYMELVVEGPIMEVLFDFDLTEMDPNRLRMVIRYKKTNDEVGVLYFEKAKKRFLRKPISMGGWGCVDAKMDKFYEKVDYNITPKDVVSYCQELIMWAGY
jgi:hypothetical protein